MKHIYLLFLLVFTLTTALALPTNDGLTPLLNQQEQLKNDIKIFPNPARGNEVTIISKTDLKVEIFDVLGKKVKVQNITLNQNKLNISDLKKGIYLLKFKTDTEVITKKLLRQ